jgi:hypothetical protein
MTEKTAPGALCPYLGLADDRDSRFSYPEAAHRCFAAGRAAPITVEHQSAYCLTQGYPTCSRYVEPAPDELSAPSPVSPKPETEALRPPRFPLWVIFPVALVGLLVVGAALHFYLSSVLRPGPVASGVSEPLPGLTASLTPTPTPTERAAENTPTPVSIAFLETPTATAAPASDDGIYALSPAEGDIGWVTNAEERGNHFGDSFLYAGVFDGQIYVSAFQFDLGSIPRGAPILNASLQLTGLRGDRLGEEGGAWTVRLLAGEIDENWRRHNYQEIFNAPALQALSPSLGTDDLAVGQTNTLELSPDQIRILEERIVDQEDPKVSFRIDGPLLGSDNLFAWDTGHGPRSEGNKVTLMLEMGEAPATPPPYDYIVVTSTPTPENALTAAAIVLQMTADATRIGTATPLPPNLATATPWPSYLVIVPTGTPGNQATAQAMVARATAEALTTGTVTPIPTNAVTATPTPTPTSTPPPVPLSYVVITATPTPESIFAAATLSAAATSQAQRLGTPTPLPADWVTPLVVTSTPTPANQVTAQFLADLATAQAFTTGTPSPTPVNQFTATPTPVFVLLDGQLPPATATPVAEIISSTMPPELIGKIAFKSNRSGQDQIYVINADGSGLGLLPEPWPYDLAVAADACSVDGRFRVFVKDAIINTGIVDETTGESRPIQLKIPTLYYFDSLYEVEEQLTYFGVDENHQPIAYDPAWSPTAEQIVFVSDDSGNDEIWVVNRDGSNTRQLTRNEWEWDKHPSWSPDGSQIVFWSNRTGTQQIWVMDADGNNLYSLSKTGFDDWDPVWIKYPDVPPLCQIQSAEVTER